jgi:hypothetical protein
LTDRVFYVRIIREPMPVCTCGVFGEAEGQETWADQVVHTTGYGEAPTLEAKRALLERDRLTVMALGHVASDGDGRRVRLSTPSHLVNDLLTRGLISHCHRDDRYSVTMTGTGLAWTWTITDAWVRKLEKRAAAFRRLARAYAQAARKAAVALDGTRVVRQDDTRSSGIW